MEKAYKLLAFQESISNKRAKELVDRGLVYIGNEKVEIARAEVSKDTKFRILRVDEVEIIYQDSSIIVINKPPFIDSYEIEKAIGNAKLLHRLDRETSGVLMLSRDKNFTKRVIDEFRKERVKKSYIALVDGIIAEEIEIDLPIYTVKRGGRAYSKIDKKRGKRAYTKVYPDTVQGKKSLIRVEITTGRTHQIRVHLSHIRHPIVGDRMYGSYTKAHRVLLHSHKVKIFDKEFVAEEPRDVKL